MALVRALGADSGMSEVGGICADLDAEGGASGPSTVLNLMPPEEAPYLVIVHDPPEHARRTQLLPGLHVPR
jgi:hypothetical protein